MPAWVGWTARLRGHTETIGQRMDRETDTLLSLPPVAYGHRDVIVRGYVDRVVISCGPEIIASHPRSYERDDFIYDPIHYLPLLERKTAALDQAAPLQAWELPDEFATLRRRLESRMGRRGKREYVQGLRLLGNLLPAGGGCRGEGRHQAGSFELRRGEAPVAVPAGGTAHRLT